MVRKELAEASALHIWNYSMSVSKTLDAELFGNGGKLDVSEASKNVSPFR